MSLSRYVMHYGVHVLYVVIGGALCVHSTGADTDQTELRDAGSHNNDKGYIPQVSQQIREHNIHPV